VDLLISGTKAGNRATKHVHEVVETKRLEPVVEFARRKSPARPRERSPVVCMDSGTASAIAPAHRLAFFLACLIPARNPRCTILA
jgi:hypothetical protein